MRTVGTVVRGIRCPIFRQGNNLAPQIVEALLAASSSEGFQLRNHDVVGITESVVARTQGNYVSVDDIAAEIRAKFPSGELGIVFPILSRNRFSILLKAIAAGVRKVHLLLSYPSDEVGNHLMDPEMLDDSGLDPHRDILDETQYRQYFGPRAVHPFTGIDYVELYKDLIGPDKAVLHFANDPRAILQFCPHVLTADIHSRKRSKKLLRQAGAASVFGLDDICTAPASSGGGYNEQYGLLGSNLSGDDKVKLFPRDCQALVEDIQLRLLQQTGREIQVMVYGDGAFKDPVGKIWELADPVVSPGYTRGLAGTPSELKLKFLADEGERQGLDQDAVHKAILQKIKEKASNLVGQQASLGTTPRQLTDLLGSLCDLTSGSGDKGTPVVLIQGYFDNFAD
ncbi:MAG: F420-0--gamma-glutamyl ligase [Oligosphaeraceae bacterium]|nr:F420-0--gamma-glutamyl ligase [Oligosphaeraceae bacterium]